MDDVEKSHASDSIPHDTPAPFRFQERDGEILRAIHMYDGVLARRQIKQLFWPNSSSRAMEMRLSVLYQHNYLNWPSLEQWRAKPIPEAICWLGWNGAAWLVSDLNLVVDLPQTPHETQLRKLAGTLRENGVHWLREPRWSQLVHDLSVVDFRLAVEAAVRAEESLTLERWIPEGAFLSEMDEVVYSVPDRTGRVKQAKRGVRPDGYFVLIDHKRLQQKLPARARLLLELDMATHDTESFLREKILAGVAYIKSEAYKARFGHNSGRWLVVTTSTVRMKHLMHQAQQAASASVFVFTTLDQVKTANVLFSPIWWQVDQEHPRALMAS